MIQTERLLLIPLLSAHLELLLNDLPAFERELNLRYAGEDIQGEDVRERLTYQLKLSREDVQREGWHSTWAILRQENRTMIGTLEFKNIPDENWISELGFGMSQAYSRHGLMTEAANAIADWAFQQPKVARIVAETTPENIRAHRILERCGFYPYARARTYWWLRIRNE